MTDQCDELDPLQAATLKAENENLAFECALLRREIDRLTALNRMLEGRLALTTGERDRLKNYTAAIEQSRPWRVTQTLRGLLGRRW
jgi:hypothetical protein